jgi:hypothetical protein
VTQPSRVSEGSEGRTYFARHARARANADNGSSLQTLQGGQTLGDRGGMNEPYLGIGLLLGERAILVAHAGLGTA